MQNQQNEAGLGCRLAAAFRLLSLRIFSAFLGLLLLLTAARAEDEPKQFLFLTLRLRGNVVTLEKARVVQGTLKPQKDSTDEDPVIIALEEVEGKERWTIAINDPSIERLEYEDPQQPGVIKSTVVHNDDVEFIARVPLMADIHHVAVFRRQKQAPVGNAVAKAVSRKLLGRMELPKEARK